jgi:hypothetical protein
VQHVDRNKNEGADALAKASAKGEPLPSDVFYHIIGTLAVYNLEGLQITQDTEATASSTSSWPKTGEPQ